MVAIHDFFSTRLPQVYNLHKVWAERSKNRCLKPIDLHDIWMKKKQRTAENVLHDERKSKRFHRPLVRWLICPSDHRNCSILLFRFAYCLLVISLYFPFFINLFYFHLKLIAYIFILYWNTRISIINQTHFHRNIISARLRCTENASNLIVV